MASFLRDTFLFEEQEVRGWIEQLANHDLREMLDLCRTLMLSPNLRRERIFAALATGQPRALNRHHILRALIRPRHRNYLPLPQHPVVNVYTHRSPTRGRRDGEDWVPLGPYLLLSYLDEAYREEGTGEGPRGFVELEELYRSAEESLRLPRGHASAILQWLLEHGLVESYDPSLRQLTPDGRLAITQRGRLHLRWAREEWNYLREMGEVDRLCEGPGLAAMRGQAARFHEAVREQDQHAMTRASARFARLYVSALLEPYRERSPLPGPYGRALAALEEKWLREPPATPD